ncbi:MAG: hypothetical protein N3A66_10815, partial [Planctomycetota bacterium]|nr:hypothetical protein [Planctomycetota bacterium]
ALFATPMISVHGALGSVNAVAALGPLSVWASLSREDWPSRPARISCLLAMLFSALVRPESLFFVVCLIVPYGLWRLLRLAQHSEIGRTALGATVGAAITLYVIFPFILAEPWPRLRNLSLYYLQYDEESGDFRAWDNNWSGINRRISASHFADPEGDINAAIGFEIQRHPLAFARYLLVTGWKMSAGAVARALGLPRQWGADGMLGHALLTALFILAFWRREQRWTMVAALAFFLIIHLTNLGFSDRHAASILPVLLVLALRTAWPRLARWGNQMPRHATALLCAIAAGSMVLAAHRGQKVAKIRGDPSQRELAAAIAAVRELCGPNETVISRYPIMIACAANRPSVGGSHFYLYLEQIEARFQTRWILLDGILYNAYWRGGDTIARYETAREDPRHRFALLKRRE